MDVLFNLGISDNDIRNMLEQCPNMIDMSYKEINEKLEILTYIGCNLKHIKNIIVSNPCYLDRTNNDILKLISYLKEIGVRNINLVFDSNPFLLNKDDYVIREYVINRQRMGYSLKDIVDIFDSNPYVIDEIQFDIWGEV